MDDHNKLKNDLLSSQSTEIPEIQNKLYTWLKENGIINKLRAQIREQMIITLKDSSICNTNKMNIMSPKVHAINMLVAEFLVYQETLFTLSVFITEVPLLGNINKLYSYINCLENNIKNNSVPKPNFQLSDVYDILETLGIQLNTEIADLTCQYYFNKKNNQTSPLLICLFKAVITICNNLRNDVINNRSTKIESDTNEHKLNSWLVSVEDILSSINLNEEQRNTLKRFLKRYYQSYNAQEAAVYKERLQKLKKENVEIIKKVTDMEQLLDSHIQSPDTNLLFQKEQQLNQLTNIYKDKEKSMNEKFSKLEEDHNKKIKDIKKYHQYELGLKEIKILNLEKMLENGSTNCLNETNKIESNIVRLLQEQNSDLLKQLEDIKSKLDVCQEHKIFDQTCSKKTSNNIQSIATSLDNEVVRKLQKDNDELREFNNFQKQRIEELSNKISNLTKQIEKTQQVPSITTNSQTRNVKKKLHFIDDSSKMHRYANRNNSTTTTDYSTTMLESDNLTEDDMIQEACLRLKMLEMSTAKVELNLKNDQTNCIHKTNFKANKNKKSYNKMCLNLSDDSDFSNLKMNSSKINLKTLANKIGYHRSIKRSINHSQSGNDTSHEILQNTSFHDYKSFNNFPPINILLSNMNNINKKSPVNLPSSRCETPVNREDHKELSMNTSTQSSNEKQLKIKSNVVNSFPKTSNIPDIENFEKKPEIMEDIEIGNHVCHSKKSDSSERLDENNFVHNIDLLNETPVIDSVQKITTVQLDNSNDENNSFKSIREQENDHTISFGSNETDKSSDFWK